MHLSSIEECGVLKAPTLVVFESIFPLFSVCLVKSSVPVSCVHTFAVAAPFNGLLPLKRTLPSPLFLTNFACGYFCLALLPLVWCINFHCTPV